MKARSALVYSVLRLLAFLVPFGILMLFPIMQEYYWLAAIFAALIGLSLSLLFLRKPLDDATAGLAERRARAPKRRPRTSRRGCRGRRRGRRRRAPDALERSERDAARRRCAGRDRRATLAASADEGPEQEGAVGDRRERGEAEGDDEFARVAVGPHDEDRRQPGEQREQRQPGDRVGSARGTPR